MEEMYKGEAGEESKVPWWFSLGEMQKGSIANSKDLNEGGCGGGQAGMRRRVGPRILANLYLPFMFGWIGLMARE